MRDKKVEKLIKSEEKRQAKGLELIPSENYVSEDVLKANGSVFTNKYSEGSPGRRYYGGQDFTDAVERLAIERACKLFKCKYANVQPHSGVPALPPIWPFMPRFFLPEIQYLVWICLTEDT
ncbi:MAG: serine hydroxymethyltransferase [Candidatus Nomurabacteria bacterium GW2011_GWF1_42_40]|nr:MAG: serine hydroxymethyltransferase [Candidatus Nomurabacteria bacterium GW2011_GWF1_42_40]